MFETVRFEAEEPWNLEPHEKRVEKTKKTPTTVTLAAPAMKDNTKKTSAATHTHTLVTKTFPNPTVHSIETAHANDATLDHPQ